jgi:hypothetical protein
MFGKQCWEKSVRTGCAVVVGGGALACKRRNGKCSRTPPVATAVSISGQA